MLVIAVIRSFSVTVQGQSFTEQYGAALSQDGVGIALGNGQYAIATTVFDGATQRHRPKLLITSADGQELGWNELPVAGSVFLQAAQAAADGSLFLAGSVIVPDSSGHDGLVVKLDPGGAIAWVAQPERAGDEQYFDIIAMPDGGAVACGVESTGADHDAWVSGFNGDGGTLWNTTLGGILDEEAYGLALNPSGIMITGRQMNFSGKTDALFAAINLNGDIMMTTSWGGPADEVGRAIVSAGAGQFIMAGATKSYGTFDFTEQRIKENIYLIAIDINGDTMWTRSVGDTLFDRGAWCIDRADNGDLLIGGERYTRGLSDALIQRVDATGTLIWERATDTGKEEKLLDLHALSDGLVATGWSFGELSRQVLLLRRNSSGD